MNINQERLGLVINAAIEWSKLIDSINKREEAGEYVDSDEWASCDDDASEIVHMLLGAIDND